MNFGIDLQCQEFIWRICFGEPHFQLRSNSMLPLEFSWQTHSRNAGECNLLFPSRVLICLFPSKFIPAASGKGNQMGPGVKWNNCVFFVAPGDIYPGGKQIWLQSRASQLNREKGLGVRIQVCPFVSLSLAFLSPP